MGTGQFALDAAQFFAHIFGINVEVDGRSFGPRQSSETDPADQADQADQADPADLDDIAKAHPGVRQPSGGGAVVVAAPNMVDQADR